MYYQFMLKEHDWTYRVRSALRSHEIAKRVGPIIKPKVVARFIKSIPIRIFYIGRIGSLPVTLL